MFRSSFFYDRSPTSSRAGEASEDHLGQAPELDCLEHAARRRPRAEFRPQPEVSDRYPLSFFLRRATEQKCAEKLGVQANDANMGRSPWHVIYRVGWVWTAQWFRASDLHGTEIGTFGDLELVCNEAVQARARGPGGIHVIFTSVYQVSCKP